MRIIKASRGTPEDLIDAVESKIAELEVEHFYAPNPFFTSS